MKPTRWIPCLLVLILSGCASFTPIRDIDFDAILIVDQTNSDLGGVVQDPEVIRKFTDYFASLDGWKSDLGMLPGEMMFRVYFLKDGVEVDRIWVFEDRMFKRGYTTYQECGNLVDFLSSFPRSKDPDLDRELISDGDSRTPIELIETRRSNK